MIGVEALVVGFAKVPLAAPDETVNESLRLFVPDVTVTVLFELSMIPLVIVKDAAGPERMISPFVRLSTRVPKSGGT